MDYQRLADAILAHGNRRSPVYREGMLAVIRTKADSTSAPKPPYAQGTVEFDAWYAGHHRGHVEWDLIAQEHGGDIGAALDALRRVA
jgi:hypothetical protein